MKDIMGHWCKICDSVLPNEKFSGKGHRDYICKDCARLPREELTAIMQKDEIFGYLNQSNISKKNMVRLKTLSASSNKRVAELAGIAFQVGRVRSHKKQRLKYLAREHKDLLKKLGETGLILAHRD